MPERGRLRLTASWTGDTIKKHEIFRLSGTADILIIGVSALENKEYGNT
jgi:hypothetical protein